MQIMVVDIVFSLDSIITAVGMVHLRASYSEEAPVSPRAERGRRPVTDYRAETYHRGWSTTTNRRGDPR